jgi:hypothetical protein
MTNGNHVDQPSAVKDFVYDSVFSDSDPPEIPRPPQLATARWPWGSGQGLDPREEAGYELRLETLNLPASGSGKTDNVFTHSVSVFRFSEAAAERWQGSRAAQQRVIALAQNRRHLPRVLHSCASRGRPPSFCHSYRRGISRRAYYPLLSRRQDTAVGRRNLMNACGTRRGLIPFSTPQTSYPR